MKATRFGRLIKALTPKQALAQAKAYADTLVVGLLDDRGNYDASGNTFPASGGSGTSGAIMKGDIWRISVAGSLGGKRAEVDSWVRALADSPGQTASNWALNTNEAMSSTGTLSSSSGVVTIDVSAATDRYAMTLTENVTSWVFNNLPASGTFRDIAVQITQHASSAKTVVSPASSGKTAGGAWAQSAVLSSIETLVLRVHSDGTITLYPSGVFG